jgi:DNA-directed RNA polymerase specialized sigma24 family protein
MAPKAEGLVRKADLSRYMHNLTEKQRLAFSLKYEYQLGLAEIASRMGLDRKTAYEHIEAANRKIKQAYSGEKRKARARSTPE